MVLKLGIIRSLLTHALNKPPAPALIMQVWGEHLKGSPESSCATQHGDRDRCPYCTGGFNLNSRMPQDRA